MSTPLRLRYRRMWASISGASMLLFFVVLYIASGLNSAHRSKVLELERLNANTRRANDVLTAYDDEALNKARAQADMFRATLLGDEAVLSFKQNQKQLWRMTEPSIECTQEYRKIRFELTSLGAAMCEWPRIVDTVQNLQSSPGMTVHRVEIITSGDSNQRIFERITLGVTLFARLGARK